MEDPAYLLTILQDIVARLEVLGHFEEIHNMHLWNHNHLSETV